MKIILGDNQFFGINHFDLEKGATIKLKFDTVKKIQDFISNSLSLGLDGFMINSNELGYKLISNYCVSNEKEIHYSVPYPHKFAAMVNEKGMLSLISYVFKRTSLLTNFITATKLLFSLNAVHLIPSLLRLEIPKNLNKGSVVYLQNILTDLIIGLGRDDILFAYVKEVRKLGYKPGIITLNPLKLDAILNKYSSVSDNQKYFKDLIVCFNINDKGFNVFPSLVDVKKFIKSRPNYKLMGMSVFSSGASNIRSSIKFIRDLNLDYVVFGSSKIENVESNFKAFL